MPIPSYERKKLRFQICEFLIKKKQEDDKLGQPLTIKPKEMENLLQYAVSTQREGRINDLCRELGVLNDEFKNSPSKSPLKIINVDMIEEDFVLKFEANEEDLVIECSTENLENYIKEAKEATVRAERAQNKIRIEDIQNGGVRVISGDKSMEVGGGRGGRIRANIIKLMAGQHIELPHRPRQSNIISISRQDGFSYDMGDNVSFSKMFEILKEIENEDENSKMTSRSVSDAVRGLKERSEQEENLGAPLFEINNDSSFRIIV